MITLTITCIMCKEVHKIVVSDDGFEKWNKGELIQIALPELSADEREMLISKTCGKCWDKLFAEPEEVNSLHGRINREGE